MIRSLVNESQNDEIIILLLLKFYIHIHNLSLLTKPYDFCNELFFVIRIKSVFPKKLLFFHSKIYIIRAVSNLISIWSLCKMKTEEQRNC